MGVWELSPRQAQSGAVTSYSHTAPAELREALLAGLTLEWPVERAVQGWLYRTLPGTAPPASSALSRRCQGRGGPPKGLSPLSKDEE